MSFETVKYLKLDGVSYEFHTKTCGHLFPENTQNFYNKLIGYMRNSEINWENHKHCPGTAEDYTGHKYEGGCPAREEYLDHVCTIIKSCNEWTRKMLVDICVSKVCEDYGSPGCYVDIDNVMLTL